MMGQAGVPRDVPKMLPKWHLAGQPATALFKTGARRDARKCFRFRWEGIWVGSAWGHPHHTLTQPSPTATSIRYLGPGLTIHRV